jgi:PAS domain S-box-containing protein/putative nucleotidyltransferase with HDIG domain
MSKLSIKKISLIQKFSLISLIAMILFGYAFGKLLSNFMEHDMFMRSINETFHVVNQNVVKHFKSEEIVIPKSDMDYHKLTHKMGHLSLGSNIVKVKVWNKDMVVVWDDNKELVGQRFTNNEILRSALGGELAFDKTNLNELELKYKLNNDQKFESILELYIPIRFENQERVGVVFEAYQNLDPLYVGISQHKDTIWKSIISGFTLLYLALFGIVWNASKRINIQTNAILQSKQDWENTFNTITDMITVHDKDFNIIQANRAAEKLLGLPLLEKVKAKCFQFYHGIDRPREDCPACDCLKTGGNTTLEIFEPHLNKFIEIRAMPRFDSNKNFIGLIHVVRNITEKKKDEEKIKRQFGYISSLHTIDKAISSSLDLNITLNILLEQVISQLKIDAADVLLFNSHSHFLEYAVGRGFKTDIIKSSAVRLSKGYAGRAAFERKPFVINNLNNPPEGITPNALMEAEEFRTYIGVPLIAKGNVKGVLEIYHRSTMEFDPEWMDFLKTLAGQAAIAIENATIIDDLHRTYDELTLAYDSTIEGWSRALDHRDKETEGHSQRVTELTVKIARTMGIKEEELVNIRRGALLHDIGKLGVPDNILLKPGKLTDEEWEFMKRHPKIAYEILSPISFLRTAIDIPYYHHEKWDGTGYPLGLKREQIPISARIFAIVDVWDALCSDRPYRPAWPKEKVIQHISSLAGTHFDPEVADIFLKLVHEQNTIKTFN